MKSTKRIAIGVALCAVALGAVVQGALAGSRPTPSTTGEIFFEGDFKGPAGGSADFFTIRLDSAGAQIFSFEGDMPARCKILGRKQAGGINFYTDVAIPVSETGEFFVKQRGDTGIPFKVKIRGEFSGNEVTGKVEGRSKGSLPCKGEKRFRGTRTEG